ncbi:MAG: FAD-dependent oxidoreductase [Ruminococcaceae bacterium]|nr:FAD-dependent oxidoreductase [Oscillospiraceae bacterium]
MYDIIIVGAGPAGLTAALYARRAGRSVLVIEKETIGGQITYSPCVENYPSVKKISGMELADNFYEQVSDLGAEIEFDAVVSIEVEGDAKKVIGEGSVYEGRAVIIASGAKHRKLGLEREDELIGSGVSYCAVCDGAFFKGKTTAVIGGGNTALQDALYLADICKKVYLIHRRDAFRGDAELVNKLRVLENVEIVTPASVKALLGDNSLTGIELDNGRIIELDGIFIAVGQTPENEPFSSLIALDEAGYADSREDCKTRTDGIFVAGDCRKKTVRQLATAVADGATAATHACEYLEKLR